MSIFNPISTAGTTQTVEIAKRVPKLVVGEWIPKPAESNERPVAFPVIETDLFLVSFLNNFQSVENFWYSLLPNT